MGEIAVRERTLLPLRTGDPLEQTHGLEHDRDIRGIGAIEQHSHFQLRIKLLPRRMLRSRFILKQTGQRVPISLKGGIYRAWRNKSVTLHAESCVANKLGDMDDVWRTRQLVCA